MRLAVSRKVANRLRLGSRTLAQAAVRCAGGAATGALAAAGA